MSSSTHAEAFYREVVASGEVFLLEHEKDGPVTYPLSGGVQARPVWSSRSRAVRMLEGPLRRSGLVIVTEPWSVFVARDVPAMEADGVLAGVNWSGAKARGYNLEPRALVAGVESASSARAAG